MQYYNITRDLLQDREPYTAFPYVWETFVFPYQMQNAAFLEEKWLVFRLVCKWSHGPSKSISSELRLVGTKPQLSKECNFQISNK